MLGVIERLAHVLKYRAHNPFCHLFNEDCFDAFEGVPNHSIDLLICDPPYGTTQLNWDKLLPFDKLWQEFERVLKPTGVALIFASQPFTTDVIMSNRKLYRNLWYWHKNMSTGHLLTGRQPLRCIEEICVFGKHATSGATYNAQQSKKAKPFHRDYNGHGGKIYKRDPWSNKYVKAFKREYTHDHPTQILKFDGVNKQDVTTQKPVMLLRYLIRTYSNPGDTVLDPTMGSGTTGVAALEEGRNFVGFEMNEKHFAGAEARIEGFKKEVERDGPLCVGLTETEIADTICDKAFASPWNLGLKPIVKPKGFETIDASFFGRRRKVRAKTSERAASRNKKPLKITKG